MIAMVFGMNDRVIILLPYITHRGRIADKRFRTAALAVSAGVPQSYIHQSSHKRQAQRLPCGDRQAGAGTL